MEITIKYVVSVQNKEIFTLAVGPLATTLDLKEQIQAKFDIPTREQKLVYAGMILPDGLCLSTFDIGHGSTVFLARGCMRLKIKNARGQWIRTVCVRPKDTVQSVKNRLRDRSRSRGKTRKLIYACRPLDESRSLSYYGICDESPLTIVNTNFVNCENIEIFVYILAHNKTISIYVGRNDGIDIIKNKITTLVGTPADQQKLIFAGKMLHDGHDIREYDIRSHCMVYLL